MENAPAMTPAADTRPPPRRRWRWAVAAVLLLAALAWWYLEPGRWLTLDQLKASRDALTSAWQARPLATLAAFCGLYVAVAALSIPGATILTLAGGAMFGFWAGLVVVSFASSVGALLAFLASRHLLRDTVQARFGRALAPVNEGIRRDGTAYLLTLRLVPVFPFFVVNLLMGLTPIGAARFYAVSQLGMLPATAVYVNAGTQLAAIDSAGDVLSPALVASLVLLGLFPLLAKRLVEMLRARRVYRGWPKPPRFDRNLVVVGAGAGGLVAAYIAAALKARVTLVEAHRMGGDCLHTGCVPSKALLRAAKAAQQVREAPRFGVTAGAPQVDFAAVMRHVKGAIDAIAPHDSVERYTGLGVEVLQGHARLTGPWSVEVTAADGTKQTLTTRSIVIAAGAAPVLPPVPGLADAGPLTSETLWDLAALPPRLLVLGGGAIGCELAQAFARLGSRVTLVERAPRLLARDDEEAAAAVAEALRADGVAVHTGCEALRVQAAGGAWQLVARAGDAEHVFGFDRVLCATGRRARTTGYGLEALGLALRPDGALETNERLETRYPNIFAVGDVTGRLLLTHGAAHHAWTAAVNALFGRWRRFAVDERVIPRATFTEPEVAQVGLTEAEARAQGVAFETTRYGLDDLDRAIADGEAQGFVKVLTEPGRDRVLGATIVGPHAAELLAEFTLAMRHGLGLNRVLGTVHPYPTFGEANRNVAGAWKRAHAPQGLLRWVARYHAWERRS